MERHQTYSIKCILFDLDNTLIETRKADERACKKIADVLKLKYDLTNEEALSISTKFLRNFRKCPENTHMDLDEWRTYLWSQALGEKHRKHAESIYRRWLLQRYQDLALPHELVSLLKSLRKKFQIALITNGTSASQWEKIERLELKHCFDLILVSGDLSYEKPDKNIFFQACQLLNVDPKRCLMVGDKLETDILGGLEAGLAGTAWLRLNSHYNLSESDPKPSYILRNVMELKHLLSKNNNEFEGKLLYKNQKDKSRMYNEDLRCEDESANDSFADYEHKTLKYLKMFHLEEDSNSNASDGS